MDSSPDYFSLSGMLIIDFIVVRTVLLPLYFDFRKIRSQIRNGRFATGTIIGFESKLDLDQRDQFAPVVSFIVNGVEYIVKSDDYKFIKAPLNSIVVVCYDIKTPSNALVNPKSLLWFKAFLMLVVLLVMASISIGILYKMIF
jgi:hypothetical protein